MNAIAPKTGLAAVAAAVNGAAATEPAAADQARVAAMQEGDAAGYARGAAEVDAKVKAERDRILKIQSLSVPGQEELTAKLIADGASPEAAALQILEAAKAAGPDQLAQLREQDKQVRVPANAVDATAGAVDPAAKTYPQTEAGWGQQYDETHGVKNSVASEFDKKEEFVALMKAQAGGLDRVGPQSAGDRVKGVAAA